MGNAGFKSSAVGTSGKAKAARQTLDPVNPESTKPLCPSEIATVRDSVSKFFVESGNSLGLSVHSDMCRSEIPGYDVFEMETRAIEPFPTRLVSIASVMFDIQP